jgi:hypothetical protein
LAVAASHVRVIAGGILAVIPDLLLLTAAVIRRIEIVLGRERWLFHHGLGRIVAVRISVAAIRVIIGIRPKRVVEPVAPAVIGIAVPAAAMAMTAAVMVAATAIAAVTAASTWSTASTTRAATAAGPAAITCARAWPGSWVVPAGTPAGDATKISAAAARSVRIDARTSGGTACSKAAITASGAHSGAGTTAAAAGAHAKAATSATASAGHADAAATAAASATTAAGHAGTATTSPAASATAASFASVSHRRDNQRSHERDRYQGLLQNAHFGNSPLGDRIIARNSPLQGLFCGIFGAMHMNAA